MDVFIEKQKTLGGFISIHRWRNELRDVLGHANRTFEELDEDLSFTCLPNWGTAECITALAIPHSQMETVIPTFPMPPVNDKWTFVLGPVRQLLEGGAWFWLYDAGSYSIYPRGPGTLHVDQATHSNPPASGSGAGITHVCTIPGFNFVL